jgi:hypothetical protein
MSKLVILENASDAISTSTLPTAAWDLVSFFENAKSYMSVAGGSLISLLGLGVVIWAAVLIAKKFFGNAQSGQQDSWVKVVLMILVGGALMTGGIVLISEIAGGGQTTITELGGGFIVLQSTLGLVH